MINYFANISKCVKSIIILSLVIIIILTSFFVLWQYKHPNQASEITNVTPQTARIVKAPDNPRFLTYSDDSSTLFVADDFGIRAFDITNELNPVELGDYTVAGIQNMKLIGSKLYLLLPKHLKILDVSSPSNITQISDISIQSQIYISATASSLALANGKLYIGNDTPEIMIYDLSDANNPVFEKSIKISETQYRYSKDLQIKTIDSIDYAIVANETNGLIFVNTATSTVLYTLPVKRSDGSIDSAQSLFVNGNYLYVGATNSNLQVVSGLEKLGSADFDPQVVDRVFPLKAWGNLRQMVMAGNYLYAVNTGIVSAAGAYVFDATNPADLVWLPGPEDPGSGFIPSPNFPSSGVSNSVTYTKNGYLIVSDNDNLFDVYKPATDPGSVRTNYALKKAPTLHGTYDVSFLENKGMVAITHTGVDLFDATNPQKPIYRSSYGHRNTNVLMIPNDGTGAATAKGNYVIYSKSDQDSQFVIVDASNLSNPVLISSLVLDPTTGLGNGDWDVREIKAYGNMVYIAGGKSGNLGLYSIDISDIQNPVFKSFLKIGASPWRLTLGNGYLYVADQSQGIITIDISDPTSPRALDISYLKADGTTIPTNYPNVLLYSHYLVYTNFYSGLYFFDVADPLNPVYVSHYTDGYCNTWAFDINGSILYSGASSGLSTGVYDIENPSSIRRLTYGGGTSISEAELRLKVYDNLAFATGPGVYTSNHIRILQIPELIKNNLSISKTVSDNDETDQLATTSSPGESLQYKLTYKNEGNGTLTNIKITDQLPELTSYESGGSYDHDTNLVNFDIGSLAPGASGTISFNVKIFPNLLDGNHEIINFGQISSTEIGVISSNEVVSNVSVSNFFSLNKTVSDTDEKDFISTTSSKGEKLDYKLNYKNTGNSTLTNVVLSDKIPQYVDYLSGGQFNTEEKSINFEIGNLEPGDTGVAVFSVKIKDELPDGNYKVTNFGSISSVELSSLDSNEVNSLVFVATPQNYVPTPTPPAPTPTPATPTPSPQPESQTPKTKITQSGPSTTANIVLISLIGLLLLTVKNTRKLELFGIKSRIKKNSKNFK